MASRRSVIEILINAKDRTKRGVSRARKGLRGLGAVARGLAAAGIAFLSTKAIQLTRHLFEVGSAALETESKFRTVFGKMGDQAEEFAVRFGRMAGLTEEAAKDALASTTNLARGIGFADEESLKFSQDLLKLAGDLASFNNVSTARAQNALVSAINGEREALKGLDIVLRQVDVDQRALLRAQKEGRSEITELDRAYATLELATERAGAAVGDLARTSDSAANVMKQTSAAASDLEAEFGKIVTKIIAGDEHFTTFRDTLRSVTDWLRQNQATIVKWGRVLIAWGKTVIEIFWNVGKTIVNALTLADATVEWVLDNAVLLLTEGIDRFTGKINELIKAVNDVTGANIGLIGSLTDAVGAEEAAIEAGERMADTKTRLENSYRATENAVWGYVDAVLAANRAEEEALEIQRERESDSGGGGGSGPSIAERAPVERLGEERLGLESQMVPIPEPDHLETANPVETDDVTRVEAFATAMDQVYGNIQRLNGAMLESASITNVLAGNAFAGLATAMDNAFLGGIAASEQLTEALVTGNLEAVGQIAANEGKVQIAKGIAKIAEGIWPPNPAAFASAKQHFAAAGAFFAIAGTVGSGGGGASGGAGGVGGVPRTRDNISRTQSDLEDVGGENILVIEGDPLLDMSNPDTEERLRQALEDLSGRRVVVERRP